MNQHLRNLVMSGCSYRRDNESFRSPALFQGFASHMTRHLEGQFEAIQAIPSIRERHMFAPSD